MCIDSRDLTTRQRSAQLPHPQVGTYPSHLNRAEAAIQSAVQKYHNLGPNGVASVACPDPGYEVLRRAVGDHLKLFPAADPEMFDPDRERLSLVNQVEVCIAYLSRLMAFGLLDSERYEPCSSYSLKAYASKWGGTYVCNGALIVAAEHLRLVAEGVEYPNVIYSAPDPEAFAQFSAGRRLRTLQRWSGLLWPGWSAPRWVELDGE
jgi:hypothetical protein